MDMIQSHVYSDCKAFIGNEFKHEEFEITISIGLREAYVIMKALEDQQRYLHPRMAVPESSTDGEDSS